MTHSYSLTSKWLEIECDRLTVIAFHFQPNLLSNLFQKIFIILILHRNSFYYTLKFIRSQNLIHKITTHVSIVTQRPYFSFGSALRSYTSLPKIYINTSHIFWYRHFYLLVKDYNPYLAIS